MTEAEMCLRVDLYRALGRLSPQERQVVLLMAVFGLSQEETARVLRMSRWRCCRLFRETISALRVALALPGPGRTKESTKKPA